MLLVVYQLHTCHQFSWVRGMMEKVKTYNPLIPRHVCQHWFSDFSVILICQFVINFLIGFVKNKNNRGNIVICIENTSSHVRTKLIVNISLYTKTNSGMYNEFELFVSLRELNKIRNIVHCIYMNYEIYVGLLIILE